jgi:hypothetical protein
MLAAVRALLHVCKAVAADAGGMSDTALSLYCKLLSCLNRCHALETAPAAQAAIMARFQVCGGGSRVETWPRVTSMCGLRSSSPISRCAATASRVQAYLERAEQLRQLQGR